MIDSAGEGAILGVLGGLATVIRDRRKAIQSTHERLIVLHKLLQHNLRNRINVIAGHASLLEAASESQAEREATIETQIDEMLTLIDDARIAAESASDRAGTTRIDPSDMLDRGVAVIEATYPDARMETDYPGDVSVLTDEVLGGRSRTSSTTHSDTTIGTNRPWRYPSRAPTGRAG